MASSARFEVAVVAPDFIALIVNCKRVQVCEMLVAAKSIEPQWSAGLELRRGGKGMAGIQAGGWRYGI